MANVSPSGAFSSSWEPPLCGTSPCIEGVMGSPLWAQGLGYDLDGETPVERGLGPLKDRKRDAYYWHNRVHLPWNDLVRSCMAMSKLFILNVT